MILKRALSVAMVAGFILFAACSSHTHDGSSLYTCPMHPEYTSDRPGQCPICGMTLVPVKKTSAEDHYTMAAMDHAALPEGMSMVPLTAEKREKIGFQSSPVTKGPAQVEIRAAARVAFDQGLLIAQREFLETKRLGDKSLSAAAKRRLILMGMNRESIDALARRGKTDEGLVSPSSSIWIYASIYEREIPFVKTGAEARIELPDGTALGKGKVRSIDTVLDAATRTARARIELSPAPDTLKPNMFVNAIIEKDLGEKLIIPKSSVIDSGKRKIVFVESGGMLIPREISLGAELPDGYVVEGGLTEGERVATSALFLIDSESKLKATAQKQGHVH